MTSKFLVNRFFTLNYLDRLYAPVSRSFNSACITNKSTRSHHHAQFNDMERRPSKQLIVPFIRSTPNRPLVLPGNFGENLRTVHGSACLMKSKEASKDSGITYSVVPRERSEIVSKFLIHYYHQMEPITMALGMPVKEVDGWFHRYIRFCMFASVQDVSIQAIDDKARKRVGILSSVIIDPALAEAPSLSNFLNEDKHPVNVAMQEFYAKLEEGLITANFAGVSQTGSRPMKMLEHMYLSTSPSYAGQGISSRMVELSENIAASIINCQIGYAVATSEFSYKVFLKKGYEVAKEIKYADYVDSNGQKAFADKLDIMKPHEACRAMVKRLPDTFAA